MGPWSSDLGSIVCWYILVEAQGRDSLFTSWHLGRRKKEEQSWVPIYFPKAHISRPLFNKAPPPKGTYLQVKNIPGWKPSRRYTQVFVASCGPCLQQNRKQVCGAQHLISSAQWCSSESPGTGSLLRPGTPKDKGKHGTYIYSIDFNREFGAETLFSSWFLIILNLKNETQGLKKSHASYPWARRSFFFFLQYWGSLVEAEGSYAATAFPVKFLCTVVNRKIICRNLSLCFRSLKQLFL